MGMEIIPDDLITEIEADTEDAEFPVSNMLQPHSRETYAAAEGETSAVINIKTIGSAANGLMLYYLLGDSLTTTVYDAPNLGGSVVEGPTVTPLLASDAYYSGTVQVPAVWLPYTSPGVDHSIKVEISRTGYPPEIGRAFAGKRWVLSRNPQWGLGNTPDEQHIIEDLDNGFEYILQRNVRKVRPGTLSLRGKPATEYHTFLHMMEQIGPNPVPVLMVKDATPIYRYLMYGRFADVKGTEAKYNNSTINFTLKEFL